MMLNDSKQVSDVLSNIINFTDDAIISKTTEGIITTWNPGAERMFGHTAEEAIGKHISIIIPEDRLNEGIEIVRKVINHENIDHFETERTAKNGTRVYVSLIISPIKDSKGIITGILRIARDVSIRKRAEEVEARMSEIIKFSDDAIITKTQEGIITSWNHGAEKIFGYTSKEIVGKHISILIPEGRLNEEPQIIEKIKQGKYIDHYETERQRKDGEVINISLTVSPIKDSDGKLIGISKIARDITVQKKSEKLLSWLAAIIDYSDDAIISKTLDGRISTWNEGAKNIFGYAKEEVIGKHVSILIPPGRMDEEPMILEKIKVGEVVDHYETVRVRKDGSTVQISLTVSPIKDAAGNIVGASKIARDITEKKAWEDEIIRLNSQLGAFNYSISHDLKAPLRIMNNYLGILIEDHSASLDTSGHTLVEKIRKNSDRMNNLIDDLLSFSQLGKQDVKKVSFSMEGLVKDVVNEQTSIGGDKINITINELSAVDGDRNLLRQVWVNLLSNAIKYSAKKETVLIHIGSTKTESEITYFIKDNGVGFDMRYSNNLFKAFQRLHNQADFEGSGIGLAIVEQIIVRHAGKVWAESKTNEGSTFYFSLPRS